MNLTDDFIANITKPGWYKDSECPGLYLKVTKNSNKVFVVRLKLQASKKSCTVKILESTSSVPDGTASIESARRQAKLILSELARGLHPTDGLQAQRILEEECIAAERAREKFERTTIREILDMYLGVKIGLKESTKKFYRYAAQSMKDWLDKPLSSIGEIQFAERYRDLIIGSVACDKIHAGKCDHVGKANSFVRTFTALYNYAACHPDLRHNGEPLFRKNPATYLRRLGKGVLRENRPRSSFITDAQLRPWLAAVLQLEIEQAKDLLILLLFTGLRKDEALSLRFSDVDWQQRTLTANNTKNRVDHVLPLTVHTEFLLRRRLSQSKDRHWVFEGHRGGAHLTDIDNHISAVIDNAGVYFKLHDLRRSFGSIAARIRGSSDYVVKRLLNHRTKSDVTQYHYIQHELEFLRKQLTENRGAHSANSRR